MLLIIDATPLPTDCFVKAPVVERLPFPNLAGAFSAHFDERAGIFAEWIHSQIETRERNDLG